MSEQESERGQPQGSQPTPEDPGRRRMLKIGVGVLGSGLAAVSAVPAIGFVCHPLTNNVTSSGEGYLPVGKRSQFSPTIPVKVDLFASRRDAWTRVDSVKVGSAWVLEQDGKLIAYSTTCPHLGCAVDFDANDGVFKCPCHRSEFKLDGAPASGPSPRPLDTLDVQEDEGLVAIRFQRFRQGISEKVEV